MIPKELKIQINGRTLAALDFGGGSGERVVLAVHGWLDNAASFTFLAPRLSGCRVISLDLVGHGRSDWRADGDWYGIWDYVLDVHACIEKLQLTSVHLLGHSLGAGVLSMLAAVMPDRVASLVMLEGLGPLGNESGEAPAQLAKALEWRLKEPVEAIIYKSVERMIQVRMRGRFPVGGPGARELVARGIKEVDGGLIWSHDPRLLAPSVARLAEPDVRSFLAGIGAPVLVCLADQGIATAGLRNRLTSLSNLRVVELSGGHHPHLEHESLAVVADALNDFYRILSDSADIRECGN